MLPKLLKPHLSVKKNYKKFSYKHIYENCYSNVRLFWNKQFFNIKKIKFLQIKKRSSVSWTELNFIEILSVNDLCHKNCKIEYPITFKHRFWTIKRKTFNFRQNNKPFFFHYIRKINSYFFCVKNSELV